MEATTTPTFMVDHRWDLLAANDTVAAAVPGLTAVGNLVRWLFTAGEAQQVLVNWDQVAHELVGEVRAGQAYHPDDPWYEEMFTELTAVSATAQQLWNVQCHLARPKPATECQVRSRRGRIRNILVTRLGPVDCTYHGLQIIELSPRGRRS